jgi:integrase
MTVQSPKPAAPPSRHALVEPITTVAPRVAIYRTNASPYWQARVLIQGRYRVKSTKERSKIAARDAAIEIYNALVLKAPPSTPVEFTFAAYAHRYLTKLLTKVERGELNAKYVRTVANQFLGNKDWGLLKTFGHRDARSIPARVLNDYMEGLTHSSSTRNSILSAFRGVMEIVKEDHPTAIIPDTKNAPRDDKPRPMFWFEPLVEKCEFKELLWTAMEAAENKDTFKDATGRNLTITHELHDFILFAVGSFLRPHHSELFGVRYKDVIIPTGSDGLQLTIPDGKTGFRHVNTLDMAKDAFLRQRKRNPNAKPDDYVWFHSKRSLDTVMARVASQFNYILKKGDLKRCPKTGQERTLYSLRHTAISMCLWSNPETIYLLARNAGTGVDMIERFYAKHLPNRPEMAAKIQGDTTEKFKPLASPKVFPWSEEMAQLQVKKYYRDPKNFLEGFKKIQPLPKDSVELVDYLRQVREYFES